MLSDLCCSVTHRIISIADSDLIVVLEDGRVLDSGAHGELLDRCGVYQQLASKKPLIADHCVTTETFLPRLRPRVSSVFAATSMSPE